MKFDLQTALKEVVRQITTRYPLFASKLLAPIPLQADDTATNKCQTAYTDGKIIAYWTEYVHSLTVAQRVTLTAHELSHIIFGHHVRFIGKGLNHDLVNVACDHAINILLFDMGFAPLPNWLCDFKYRGWSAERIYRDLASKSKKEQEEQIQRSKKSGGECQQQKNDDGSELSPEQVQEELEKSKEELQRAVNQLSRTKKGIEESESLKPAEKRERLQEVGRGYGEIFETLKDIHASQVDWRTILASFLFDLAANDFNMEAPDEEDDSEFYMPTIESTEVGKVGLMIDVSGSLGHLSKTLCSEVFHCLSQLDLHELQVFYVSNRIHATPVINSPEDIQEVRGGGTCFKPFFNEWMIENDPDIKALVVITDGYVYEKDKWIDPAIPVLWVMTGRNSDFEETVPFGTTVRMIEP